MAGLSTDPDKAQRQLDGLAAGRMTQARTLLGLDAGAAPAPSADPAAGGPVPVHRYPDPEPEGAPNVEPEPAAEPTAEPEPQRRRGFFAGVLAGLAD